MAELVIRNAEIDGVRTDVAIGGGRILAIGPRLEGETIINADGGALIPGLADHHLHLLATAARVDSVILDGADPVTLGARIRRLATTRPPGTWIRAVGYHENVYPDLDRAQLDAIAPDHPIRVQHQTGGLWILNSAALALVGDPPGGAADGRIFRQDAWLRRRIGGSVPALAPLGAALARLGITHVTDASVTTDAAAAAILGNAARDGTLPVHLTLMAGSLLPPSPDYAIGPMKILLDDDRLPTIEEMVGRIAIARSANRAVAVHCVTAGELAITLAAFETAGTRPGDRVEHGAVIVPNAIPVLRRLGLRVVTQSIFVRERGDRYRAHVDPRDRPDLYRCASLIKAGIAVAGSSDAPYGSLDPWKAMQTATHRVTAAGVTLGSAESVMPHAAMSLYLSPPADPGGAPRRVVTGAAADLCLLGYPLSEVLADPRAECVAGTFRAGRPTYRAV